MLTQWVKYQKDYQYKKGKVQIMSNNPDTYLLYECMNKVYFTVRMKVCLDSIIDEKLLYEAAQEAISRLPYFSIASMTSTRAGRCLET